MYKIEINNDIKLISIVLSGNMQKEEFKLFIKDVIATVMRFDNQEASLLIEMERFDPLSQDCLPILMDNISSLLKHLKKVASVHRRFITQMQMRRIEAAATSNDANIIKIARFHTRQEALEYLSE